MVAMWAQPHAHGGRADAEFGTKLFGRRGEVAGLGKEPYGHGDPVDRFDRLADLGHRQDNDLDAAAQRRLRLERVEWVLGRVEPGQAMQAMQSGSPKA